jgi:predicted CxxxxCH...CXXCH cytochrome family protein
MSDGVPCGNCHRVPGSMTDAGHLGADSVAEVVWGGFSNLSGGANWNRLDSTCSSTYCHGNFAGGNVSNATIWTQPRPGECGTCHDYGIHPGILTGRHLDHAQEGVACYRCHAATVNSTNAIIGRGVHVDGKYTVIFWNSQGSYDSATKRCTSPGGCHDDEDW